MKISNMAYAVVILIVGGYFLLSSEQGRTFISNLFSEDRERINRISLSFMEDIKFKDFKKAASYHHPKDREKVDIPRLIERLFKIKPELLDIMDYEILETSLDSSRTRGRVKLSTKVQLLNQERIEHPEMILYYHHRDGRWYMELESSLR